MPAYTGREDDDSNTIQADAVDALREHDSKAFGVSAEEVDEMLRVFPQRQDMVEAAIMQSRLSAAARQIYLEKFRDRLKALAQ